MPEKYGPFLATRVEVEYHAGSAEMPHGITFQFIDDEGTETTYWMACAGNGPEDVHVYLEGLQATLQKLLVQPPLLN